MKIDGKSFKITLSEVAISHEDGRAYRDGRLECMNEYSGNTLTLTFYEDGEVRIKFGVSPHTISEIKFNNATGLIAIKYIEGEEVSEARYSLNFKSLGEQLGKHDLASLQTKRSLEGQTGVSLNRILFELLGYQARKELRGRIGKDVSGDKRVVLLVHFALEGNKEKVAYCGNEKLEVDVPENAKEITTIEIVPFKDLMDIKKSVIKVIDNPSDWNKGKLGEAIANNKMDDVFNKFAEKFGLSEEELHQLKDKSKVIPRGDPGEPDFERIAIDIITIKGKTFKAGDRIAVIEVKYVSSPENVEEFKCAIGDAKDEVNTRFESSEWTAPYGIIFVVSWPPSQILGDEPMPSNVGGYNNPYIDALENPKIKG